MLKVLVFLVYMKTKIDGVLDFIVQKLRWGVSFRRTKL